MAFMDYLMMHAPEQGEHDEIVLEVLRAGRCACSGDRAEFLIRFPEVSK